MPVIQQLEVRPATVRLAVPEAGEPLVWDEDGLPHENYEALSARLAAAGDLFRATEHGNGLIVVRRDGRHEIILKGADLLPVVVDRVPVRVVRSGESKGGRIPAAHLSAMLRSESFLENFPPVDLITRTPVYLPNFKLVTPGYNDGGDKKRVLYLGGKPEVATSLETINAFLNVMDFESAADRTNTVAAGLTVLLRNFWPGGKPIILATATRSHAGKDTVLDFAAGLARLTSISYQSKDWPVEQNVVRALKKDTDTGVVVIENARLDHSDRYISSAFIERFTTDPQPFLSAPGTGSPMRITNNVVVGISTNFGTVSEDILNRALPIHLAPAGDVSERKSPIGNPRHEFLPRHRGPIAAEFRLMVERWREAGMPIDESVWHPFGPWAKTVGGILIANGFPEFLRNYDRRKMADDPVRKGLGILGATAPDKWLTPTEWAKRVSDLGLKRQLISPGEQGSDAGCARGIGLTLSNHQGETFVGETDSAALKLRLEKHRGRFGQQQPHVRYRFVTIDEKVFEEDTK